MSKAIIKKPKLNKIAGVVHNHLLSKKIDEGTDFYGLAKDMIKDLENLFEQELPTREPVLDGENSQYLKGLKEGLELAGVIVRSVKGLDLEGVNKIDRIIGLMSTVAGQEAKSKLSEKGK